MLQKLSEKVYYMKYDDSRARPSLGLVVGSGSSLMIDAGNSVEQAEEFLKYTEVLGVGNIRYLGVTHYHWDHIYGIPYLGLHTIGSEKTQKKLERLNRSLERGEKCEVEETNTMSHLINLAKDMKSTEIEVGFSAKLRLNLGGVSCIFEHIGGDHSDDSALIYVESEKIMFLGDSTYRGFRGSNRYHSLENVEAIARKILNYDCEIYVTSHKEIYSRADMESMLYRMVKMGKMAEGYKSLEEIEKNLKLDLSELDTESRFYLEAFLAYNRILIAEK